MVELASPSQVRPAGHEPPPHVASQTQKPVLGSQTKPVGQPVPHSGGWQKPQPGEPVSLLQVWFAGQPPPQVVSHSQTPQVGEPVSPSQV